MQLKNFLEVESSRLLVNIHHKIFIWIRHQNFEICDKVYVNFSVLVSNSVNFIIFNEVRKPISDKTSKNRNILYVTYINWCNTFLSFFCFGKRARWRSGVVDFSPEFCDKGSLFSTYISEENINFWKLWSLSSGLNWLLFIVKFCWSERRFNVNNRTDPETVRRIRNATLRNFFFIHYCTTSYGEYVNCGNSL